MKPRRKKSFGSLDSLLDTMTTVVGILVIMLIVIQLDVSQTVKRIVRAQVEVPEDGVPLEQVATVRETLAAIQSDIRKKDEMAHDLRAQNAANDDETQSLRTQADALRDTRDTLKKKAATNTRVAALETQLAALQATDKKQRERLKTASAELRRIPIPRRLPTKVVTLPDPKAAPPGAQPYYIMCRTGRVVPIDTDFLRKAVAEHIENRSGLKPNTDDEWDGDKAINYLKRVRVGNRNWRVTASISKHRLIFPLAANRGAGEFGPQAVKPNSAYVNTLRGLDPKKKYLVYLVWPDSYETYLAARAMATRGKFAIGWRPMDAPTWNAPLGTYLVHGYKKSLPPPPKPGAAPPPAAKPKPVDVVD